MKHTVTDLEGSNEPINYAQQELQVCLLDSMFGCYRPHTLTVPQDIQIEIPVQILGLDSKVCSLNLHTSGLPSLNTETWTLYYDGPKTNDGAGAGCVLVDPKGNRFLISCTLEFQCTNKTAENKALVLDLKKAIDLKADYLQVIGDSKISKRQVCNTIHYLSPHLKNYQQDVWCLINSFKAFNIIYVPRFNNATSDTTARFTPHRDGFSIEIMYKPAVPENVTNLHIFNDY